MKFVSFNINGIRAHIHQLNEIIIKLQPDVIGLQEIKVHNNFFPTKQLLKYGYHMYYSGQKKYHGVALFLRQPSINTVKTIINNNDLFRNRIIIADIMTPIGILTIINAYFPQGDNINNLKKFEPKKQFYKNLLEYIQYYHQNHSLLMIMGDMNISHTDLDIGLSCNDKKKWLDSGKCSFLPEERLWINKLLNWGLIDIYRNLHPKMDTQFSWFSYRSNRYFKNQGLRIDLILTTQTLANYCKSCNIDYNIRSMKKSSDHAPIWACFEI